MNGLILSGGGARAAYQVGVLQAIAEMWAMDGREDAPFRVYAGTSAGAINAACLATHNDRWSHGVDHLASWWSSLQVEQVYRSDRQALWSSARSWMGALGAGLLHRQAASTPPESLLDNSPLKNLLHHSFPPMELNSRLHDGSLHALAVTAFNYTTGRHTVFYQSAQPIEPWRRNTRDACPTVIGPDHLLASSALPMLFPTVPLNGQFFGDGALRQTNPVSPALHLGASRVLVIGVSPMVTGSPENATPTAIHPPSPGQILGQAMANIMIDQLGSDVERIETINRILDEGGLDEAQQQRLGLRRVALCNVRPSARLDQLATDHWDELPRSMRRALAVMGVDARRPAVGSYLLFEPGYVQALMELGREDAWRQEAELRAFLTPEDVPVPERSARPVLSRRPGR